MQKHSWHGFQLGALFVGRDGEVFSSLPQAEIAQEQCPLRGCSYLHPNAKERGTIKQMLNHESSHSSSLLKSKGALSRLLS